MKFQSFLSCPAFLAAAGFAAAQTAQEPIVRAPEMVVSEPLPEADASGTTRANWAPETGAPLDAWESLSRSAANFHVSASGAGGYGGLFAVRGLANTPYFSEPAVTVYFADIPLPSSFTYPNGLFAINSAALFRGPQGTQFGRATDGGVVAFSIADRGPDAWGEATAGAGNYDERHGDVEVSSGSSGKTDALFAGSYSARDGFISNQSLGVRVDDSESEDAFARVRLRPAPGEEWTLEALQTRARDGARPLVPLGGPLFEVSRAREGKTDLDSQGAALKGSFLLPAGTLSTVTSFADWRMNPYQSFLVLPPPLENQIIQDQKSWNEEVQAVGTDSGPIRTQAGLWLSKATTGNAVNRSISGVIPIELSDFQLESESAAVFAQAAWVPNSVWRITAGVRAETDGKQFDRQEQVPVAGLDYAGSGRYRALLPKFDVSAAVGPDSHLDLAVAAGLRPGGFASYTDQPSLIPFAAERTTAFSAGWDSAFAQRSIGIAFRGFYDRIGDYQIERSFSATDYFVAVAPRAHTEGGEAEASWHPFAGWTVAANAGWTRAILDEFHSPLSGQNESGNRAPYVPENNAGLSLTYRPGRGWFAGADATEVGRIDYDEVGTAKYSQAAHTVLALRAGYETSRWILTIYGENLGNEGYYELIIPGVNSGNPGAPRTYGGQTTLKW